MNIRHGLQLGLALLTALAGCAPTPEGTDTTATSPTAPSEPTVSPTTETAEAEPFEFPDAGMTYYAADPWTDSGTFWGVGIPGPDYNFKVRLELVGDPRPVETGCRQGAAPADAEALARTIRSDPDLAATAPATVTVGGVEALRMDVTAAPGVSVCEDLGAPLVVAPSDRHPSGVVLEHGSRTRLYLLDVPQGSSTRILAIAIAAPEDRFKTVVEAAAPIVDSVEFHAP